MNKLDHPAVFAAIMITGILAFALGACGNAPDGKGDTMEGSKDKNETSVVDEAYALDGDGYVYEEWLTFRDVTASEWESLIRKYYTDQENAGTRYISFYYDEDNIFCADITLEDETELAFVFDEETGYAREKNVGTIIDFENETEVKREE